MSRHMRMFSGERVSTTDGAPTLADIARGLSRTNRFGGQTVMPWSVAAHSLLCLSIFNRWRESLSGTHTPIQCLHVLLHDAHEAMTGDIPRPFKTEEISEIQRDLDRRIYEGLGLGAHWPLSDVDRASVKYVDDRALLAEALVLTPPATYDECRKWFNGMSEAQSEDVRMVWDIIESPEQYGERAFYEVALSGIRQVANG